MFPHIKYQLLVTFRRTNRLLHVQTFPVSSRTLLIIFLGPAREIGRVLHRSVRLVYFSLVVV